MSKGIKTIIAGLTAAFAFIFMIPYYAAATGSDIPHVITVYNENNGLPTGEANAVVQTTDGYIWIGSYGGLIRYDGTDFRNYSMENSDIGAVRSLFEDSTGRLWIGTNDAGVFVMEKDKFTHIELPSDRSFSCVRDFTEDDSGRIFIASSSGMAEIHGNTLIPVKSQQLSGEVVYSVAVDSLGRVWGALNYGRCAVVKDRTLLGIFTSDTVLDNGEIYYTASDKEGNILLGTSVNTIVRLEFISDSLESDGYKTEFIGTGNVTTHNHITVSENGSILVSGLKGFAVIDENGALTQFSEKEKASSINAAVCDYENNFWLASSDYGVIKYTAGCFNSPNSTAMLENTAINAVAGNKGRFYLGTDTGLIIYESDWVTRVSNSFSEMYDGVRIRHIITDKKGRIWVASYSDNTVGCYNPSDESVVVYNNENGLISNRARTLLELSDGGIAVGTTDGICIIRDGSVVRSYGNEQGVEITTTLCLAEGENGIIYAGSDGGGIYALSGDTVVNFGYEEGLEDGVVLRIAKTADNEGYFISAGSSLYLWDESGFRKLTGFSKSAGSIFDIYDRDGKLWLLQNSGFYAVDKAALLSGQNTDTYEYGLQHGLSGSINANTWNWLSNDGTLYMSTRNGISTFSFKGIDNCLPKAVISKVSTDGKIFEHPSELNIEKGTQRITIDFSALSYTDTTPLRIAYKLEGFEKNETVTDNKSGSISYTNLPGGEYIFNLRIYNPQNPDEQNIIRLKIVKEKMATEIPVFWILMAVLLVAICCVAVILFTRIKLVRMRRRQQAYRQIVDQSLQCFAKTIDAKDKYTNGHSLRVAQYSREIARRMGKSEQEQENIYYIALLHDIGKIGVPDSILNKPGKLTDEERSIIQTHPAIGSEILKEFNALEGISEGAKYHHERYDGKGYCEGLSGKDIPEIARIIGVADTYDAMSSDRCYRKALSHEQIEAELKRGIGTQFDPEIVPYMLEMIEEGIVPFKNK